MRATALTFLMGVLLSLSTFASAAVEASTAQERVDMSTVGVMEMDRAVGAVSGISRAKQDRPLQMAKKKPAKKPA